MLSVFQWFEYSVVGETIRESLWLFPAIEAIHLLALAVIGGAVLVVDLRLFGLGMVQQPVSRVATNAQPWLTGSLIVMILSGSLLFTSEATKCYYNDAFWFKMTALFLAIIYTFSIHRRAVMSDEDRLMPLRAKIFALVSVALWSGVGVGGRWIGFS